MKGGKGCSRMSLKNFSSTTLLLTKVWKLHAPGALGFGGFTHTRKRSSSELVPRIYSAYRLLAFLSTYNIVLWVGCRLLLTYRSFGFGRRWGDLHSVLCGTVSRRCCWCRSLGRQIFPKRCDNVQFQFFIHIITHYLGTVFIPGNEWQCRPGLDNSDSPFICIRGIDHFFQVWCIHTQNLRL